MEVRPCSLALLLTTEILIQILIRLPLESVLVCRSVCKSWNVLILQPFFADLHRSLSCPPTILLVQQSYLENPAKFGLITENSGSRTSDSSLGYHHNFTGKVIEHIPEVEIVGSCNGLMCLSSLDESYYDTYFPENIAYDNYRLVLCNPILGSHLVLPDSPQAPQFCTSSQFGFGYVSSTKQYKAVKIVYMTGQKRLSFHVFTIPSSCSNKNTPWRTIYYGEYGSGLPELSDSYSYSTFFKGSIIWIAQSQNDDECQSIVYFDVENEEIQRLALPPTIFKHLEVINERPFHESVAIGVYYDDNDGKEHLYLCEELPYCVNIWVMEDYKSIDSLELKWVIELPPHRFELVYLYKLLKDGKLLIQLKESTLACYDPNTRVLETMEYLQLPVHNSLAVDIPNLLGCLL